MNSQQLIDAIKQEALALAPGSVTQAQITALSANVGKLVDDSAVLPPPPPPPPLPPVGTSLDGTTVPPSPSITDASGGIWTIGTMIVGGGYQILLNGKSAAGGGGVKIVWKAGRIKVFNNLGDWWLWTGNGWSRTTGP